VAKSVVNVLITGDVKGLQKAVGSASDSFKKFGKATALAVGAAGAAFVAISAKLVKAGETAATSNARIEQIATSMGLFGEGTENAGTSVEELTDRLVKLAEKTARATGVDQNQIKLTQAKLLTFKELATTADELGGAFDRATKVAIDMGAAGFGSAEQNAVQLGKALNDPIAGITALTRSGITFTQAEKDVIRTLVESGQAYKAQDMILQAIEAQVGGTAEATANASDKMKVGFSQLQEQLGERLLPAFQKLTDFVLDKVFPAIEQVADVFAEEGLAGVVGMAADFIKQEGPKALEALGDMLKKLANFVVDTGLPWLLDKLEELGKALVEWIRPRIVPMLKEIGDFLGEAANWLINTGLPLLVDKLVQLGNALVEWIGPNIAPMLQELGKFLAKLLEWIITEAVPKVAAEALKLAGALLSWLAELLPKALAGVGLFVLELVKAIPGLFVDLVNAMFDAGKSLGTHIIDGLKAGIAAVVDVASDIGKEIADAVWDALKWSWNTFVAGPVNGAVRRAVNLLDSTLGPFVNFDDPPDIIPKLAKGGIVNKPTLALIGEAGPEAVVPLSGRNTPSLGGGNITINVAGSVISESDLIETVRRGLLDAQQSGKQVVYAA